jgi:hypothetical protein
MARRDTTKSYIGTYVPPIRETEKINGVSVRKPDAQIEQERKDGTHEGVLFFSDTSKVLAQARTDAEPMAKAFVTRCIKLGAHRFELHRVLDAIIEAISSTAVQIPPPVAVEKVKTVVNALDD